MATYKAKAAFTFKRFKGFWREFKRSKRGVFGAIVVCFFMLLAVIGPSLSAYDPLNPQWPGYYPAGPVPATAELCMPIWYRYLPGSEYSENMEAISDYQFSSAEALTKWRWEISNSNLISIKYNAEKGSLNDGCIEVSYKRQASDEGPKEDSAKMTYHFTYPFKQSPKGFMIHTSHLIEGTASEKSKVSMNLLFYRKDTSPLVNYTYPSALTTSEDSLIIYKYPLITYTYTSASKEWTHIWTRATHLDIFFDRKYYLDPAGKIFPTSGNYTFVIEIVFSDKGDGGKETTVYLDNINVLLYGSAFGLLGSDGIMGQPRDIFTALMHGAQISVIVGLLTAIISVSIGLLLGLVAGYVGGLTDEAIMRFADFLIGLPSLPLLIVLAVILRPSIFNIIAILSFMGWMLFSRNIRSMTLSLRERAFIEAAKAAGAGRSRILFRHVLPNVFPLVYLALAVTVPGAIMAEAALSFLGLFDPLRITWGRMLNEFAKSGVAVTKGFNEYWFWVLPPGIGISMLAISFILMGYALDEILNPQLRKRR